MTRLIRPADIEAEVREKTVINFLLDESGSMMDRKNDVIKVQRICSLYEAGKGSK